MAKNRKRGIHVVRKALYEVISEIEIHYGIQILQNTRKVEGLVEDIVSATSKSTYLEFLSEVYFHAALLKEAIISELTAAIENKSLSPSGYVLAINT